MFHTHTKQLENHKGLFKSFVTKKSTVINLGSISLRLSTHVCYCCCRYFADTLAHNEVPRQPQSSHSATSTPNVVPPPPPPAAAIVNVVVEPGGSPSHHITSVINSNKTVRIPGGVIGTSVPFKPGASDGSTNYTHPWVSVIVFYVRWLCCNG
jgi:hypothetical protein